MSFVDDAKNLYEERDELRKAYNELKERCRIKMDEATTHSVLLDQENKRLKAENERLRNELTQVRGGRRMV